MVNQTLFKNRRLTISIVFLVFGVLMLILGILAGTTDVIKSMFGLSRVEVWRFSGVLAGVGVPLSIFGVFNVLPATSKQRTGATIGLLLSGIGVLMFVMWYPNSWYGDPTDNTFLATGTYALGVFLTMGYLFISVANADTSGNQNIRRRPKSQQAKSLGALVRNLLNIATTEEDGIDLDLEEILEELEEELGDAIEEAKVEENTIKILRSDNVSHTQFKLDLPQYAVIQNREKDISYTIQIDAEVYSIID